MAEKAMWGIHAGRDWEADDLFRQEKVIAIGWPNMGNLKKFKDREAYKEKYTEVYPDSTEGAMRNAAGVFYRFVYEMKIGDLIAYPSSPTKQIYLGKVNGDYEYNPDLDADFPNQRKVKWIKNLPRTSFSQEALYEIGSALTLF